ncbi:MAG: hypothetical protein QOC81_4806 [Thermoanaerobaculia bacterium]|jgi:hypothetical protein|nr:hypothetical protein [Thermoanaerobaculia bacterium]
MKRTLAAVLVVLAACVPLAAATLTRGPDAPFGVVADFNHDGLDDLINGDSGVMRFWQNIGGSYALLNTSSIANGEQLRGTIDVNGDGIPDLITYMGVSTLPASLFPNAGTQGLPTYNIYVSTGGLNYRAAASFPTFPISIDMNSDGNDDVVLFVPNFDAVTKQPGSYTMLVERSNGDGTFLTAQRMTVRISEPERGFNRGVVVGDLNGDGHADLVAASQNDLLFFSGNADGTLSEPVSRYLPQDFGKLAWTQDTRSRLYDIDGDGNLDITLFTESSIMVLFGNGHGAFPRFSSALTSSGGPFDYIRNLAFGNFTTTSRTDIAVGEPDGTVAIFSGAGGVLKEVSRTSTDLQRITIYAGSLHAASQRSDVIITGYAPLTPNAPATQRTPRTYFGDAPSAQQAPVGRSARNRAVAFPNAPLNLSVTLVGDCAPAWTDAWQFAGDNVFVSDHNGSRNADAVVQGQNIYFRVTYADGTRPDMQGILTRSRSSSDVYSVPMLISTPCGNRVLQLQATVGH